MTRQQQQQQQPAQQQTRNLENNNQQEDPSLRICLYLLGSFGFGIFVLFPVLYFGRHVFFVSSGDNINNNLSQYWVLPQQQLVTAWNTLLSGEASSSSSSLSSPLVVTVVTTLLGIVVVNYVVVSLPSLSTLSGLPFGKSAKPKIEEEEPQSPPQQQQHPTKEPDDSNDGEEETEPFPWVMPVYIEAPEVMQEYPFLLTARQRHVLVQHGVVPRTLGGGGSHSWKRLYSVARDGDAFSTFLARVAHHRRTLLVVHGRIVGRRRRDSANTKNSNTDNADDSTTQRTPTTIVMGAYCDVEWKTTGPVAYERGPGTKLFCLRQQQQRCNHESDAPCTTMSHEEDTTKEEEEEVEVYHWTGINDYGILCDRTKQRIAFGGGGGDQGCGFALCIEANFTKASTAASPTFGNPTLCDPAYVDVLDMEVYGFPIVA